MAGPSRAKTTITTMATITRIRAYSTRPCPDSFGDDNIELTSFLYNIYGLLDER
jgi:hypothetical protein